MDFKKTTVLLITLFIVQALNAGGAVKFKGVLKNQIDSTVIPGVFIQNTKSYSAKFSNANGEFSIQVSYNDTLFFHSSGYHPYVLPIDSGMDLSNLEIFLIPSVNRVGVVRIKIVKPNEIQYFDSKTKKRVSLKEVINIVEHPITALYRNFTFRGREPDRIAARLAYYKVMDRFNYDMVVDAIKEQDEDVVLEFMDFCAFKYFEIESWNQIQLYLNTLDCYEEFKLRNLKLD